MASLKTTLKGVTTMKSKEIVLGTLFVIYYILGYPVPETMAEGIDTLGGKVVVGVLAVSLFLAVNPLVGVLGLLVAFDLLRKSAEATGSNAMAAYLPSEEKKSSELNKYNQFPYTLEQEMVSLRTINTRASLPPSSYKPVLENDHNASPVSSMMS